MSIFKELGIREGKDRVNEEVVYNLARGYGVVDRAISDILAEYGLSPAKFNILLMVKHVGKEKGLAQNELSSLLLVTTSNITRMVDKLERDKLVTRKTPQSDRRVKRITITPKGGSVLDKVWEPYKAEIDSLLGDTFTSDEKKSLNRLMVKLISKTKEA